MFTAKAQIIGTVPTSDFSVKENDTISIVCNVDGSPAPTATWTKTTGEFCSILTITFYRMVGENKFLRGGEGGRIVLGGTVLTEFKGGGLRILTADEGRQVDFILFYCGIAKILSPPSPTAR